MDLADFAARMDRRAKAVPAALTRVLKYTADTCAVEIITNTPVDEGIARSNWQLSVGAEISGTIPAHAPLPKGTDPLKFHETDNAQAAVDAGREVLSAMTRPESIFIQNSVPYIRALEYNDASPQAGHFVQAGVYRARVRVLQHSRLGIGEVK